MLKPFPVLLASSWSPTIDCPDAGSPRHQRMPPPPEDTPTKRGSLHSPKDYRERVQYQDHDHYSRDVKSSPREFPEGERVHGFAGMPQKRDFPQGPSLPRPDERRGTTRHQLGMERGGGKSRYEGYPSHRSSSLDSPVSERAEYAMRDPRLHRSKGGGSSMAYRVSQILFEHSYCKRIAGSELEPISGKTEPDLQQHAASCYLSILPTSGSRSMQRPTPSSSTPKSACTTSTVTPSSAPQPVAVTLTSILKPVPSTTTVHKPAPAPTAPVQDESTPPPSKKVENVPKEERSQTDSGSVKCDEIVPSSSGLHRRHEDMSPVFDPVNVRPNQLRMVKLSEKKEVENVDTPQSPRPSLVGFELDLDTEPDSSEDESTMHVDGPLIVSFPHFDRQWSVTTLESGMRIKFSRMNQPCEAEEDGGQARAVKMKLKQFPGNRIQLRNGRVLPPSTLAIYASRKGPGQKDSLTTPEGSPGDHILTRRTRSGARFAPEAEDDGGISAESDYEADGEFPAREGFESITVKHEPLDSDESEFDMPSFERDLTPSSPVEGERNSEETQRTPTRKRKARRGKTRFFVSHFLYSLQYLQPFLFANVFYTTSPV